MRKLNYYALSICLIAALSVVGNDVSAQVSFIGNSLPVYSEKPAASTGLDAIYVLNSIDGVSINYTATDTQANVVWYGYGAQGGAARIAATLLDKAGGTVNSSRGILCAWKKDEKLAQKAAENKLTVEDIADSAAAAAAESKADLLNAVKLLKA